MSDSKFSKFNKQSTSFKLFIIGFIVFLLMIPLNMVEDLIRERNHNKDKVSKDIFNVWGNAQTLKGPILTIPYNSYYWRYYETRDKETKKLVSKKELKKKLEYLHFLPSKLDINASITPSILYRSIYEAVVYKSKFNISGEFEKIDISQWQIKEKDILYHLASLSFGISDLRGVRDRIKINFDKNSSFFKPGIDISDVGQSIGSGVSVPVTFDKNSNHIKFNFDVSLRGSQSIFFLPYGKESVVNMVSNWSNPSFVGDFLPNSRKITKQGFKASWKVIDINRAYPQKFKGQDISRLQQRYKYYNNKRFESSSFGVDLKIPVDYYQKSKRSVKYGILIILLTFVVYFFVEIFIKQIIHPFQYILVGFGLVIFFALLISFSEHIGFNKAFLISALSTITSITLYSISVFKKNKKAILSIFAMLSLFYSFVYLLLQLQDYSLLLGTIMLFITLSVIMYVSRDINWYDVSGEEKK